MNIKGFFHSILQHPLKLIEYVYASFSVMFTATSGTTYFFPNFKLDGVIALGAISFFSTIYALRKMLKPSSIEIKIAHCDTVLRLMFGDIFEQSGLRVIAVNDFFDSELGNPVSEKSLHGIFLKKCFGGSPISFDDQLWRQLHEKIEFCPEKEGKKTRYALGSTALIRFNDDKYLVFALSRSDPTDCKASCDIPSMFYALQCMWRRARSECGGHEINVPLIGSGLSGIGLTTRDLLYLIILSAISETREREITKTICIVLHESRFDEIDLRDIKAFWEKK